MQCGAYLHDALLGLSASNTAITILCCLALLPIHRLHLWLLMLKPLRAWLLHARSFKIPKGFNISNPVCNARPICVQQSNHNCYLALFLVHRLHLWLLMLKPLRAWQLHARSFKIPKGFNISNPVCNAGPIYMMHYGAYLQAIQQSQSFVIWHYCQSTGCTCGY